MFDFYGKRKIFYIISGALILLTLIWAIVGGVPMDIQFKGGTIISYYYEGDLSLPEVQSVTQDTVDSLVTVQQNTDIATGRLMLTISLADQKSLTNEQTSALAAALEENFQDNNIEFASISSVDPIIGGEFFGKSIVAVLFAAVVLIVFIGIRFRKVSGWSAGVTAVVALFHDILIVFGAFIILGFSIDSNFIAVVLTILGYSINDTIVIYDRIRENRRLHGRKMSIPELVNKSINQSFTRSLNTTITTVLAMVCVCIVAVIYNVQSILSFAVPMIIGMISGVYSSLAIAGPLWASWQVHKEKKEEEGKAAKSKGKKPQAAAKKASAQDEADAE